MKFAQLHDVPLSDIVTFEHLTGTGQFDAQDDTYKYSVVFKALEESSLGPDQSREELARVVAQEWA